MTSDLKRRFEEAPDFRAYLETVEKNRELWHGVYERVHLPEDLVNEARALGRGWRLLALSEDWCGDAVNTLPVVARLAEAVGWPLRVLGRDDNPDLMDAHLTDGRSRSIPVVIVYDADFNEVGWWGPRPREIQAWTMAHRELPSDERYREIRRWYAKDRGASTVRELLEVVRSAAMAEASEGS
ncbi:MAG: thioredoxin family protein [Gemmatimonadetes bacterium]|nr:MAG: thioredoxin family protein [Gemmatimonadota bacterium]